MKKAFNQLFAIIMIAALAFGLTACGSNEDPDKGKDKVDNSTNPREEIQPESFIKLKEHRASNYWHDYYQVGAENFEIDFIDEGLTVYGGSTVGSGHKIKVDVNCISAPNMFPKKGYYAVSDKREAGYAVAGFFTDVSDQYNYPAGSYMLPVGCNVIFVENSAIKETVFAVDGWVYFDGTAENGTMRCAYKLENGQTIGFEYTGAFNISDMKPGSSGADK